MNLHLWLLPPSLPPLRYRAGRGGVCRDGGEQLEARNSVQLHLDSKYSPIFLIFFSSFH